MIEIMMETLTLRMVGAAEIIPRKSMDTVDLR
jgi:hypothetical protein